MTPRSLGNKRRLVTRQHNGYDIVELSTGRWKTTSSCRVFENADFGYRRVRIDRPLRLHFHASPERIERVKDQPAFAALTQKETLHATSLLDALRRLPDRPSRDPAEYLRRLDEMVQTPYMQRLQRATASTENIPRPLQRHPERPEPSATKTALPVPGKKGGYEPDLDLRRTTRTCR